ncbi:MAG: response regulator transcription factor [Herminiimonas sp.]|nr:response regulator transcription factor [Herminiimonas sp.]
MDILIIDDNEMTRMLLRTILSGDGHTVVGEISTGKAGLDQALKLLPQVICLDIEMPDLSGIDILKQVVQKLPKTIVLMVSGKNDMATVKECLSLGAAGFIIKPFTAATLSKVLREAVARIGQTLSQSAGIPVRPD